LQKCSGLFNFEFNKGIDNILRYLYNKIKEGTLSYLLKEIKTWKKIIMI